MSTVNCPHCDAGLRWKESLAGERVRCAVCETAFRVPDEPKEAEEDRPRRRPRDEDEEDRRPARRERRDDFDEEEERPRRRRSAESSFPVAGLIKFGIGSVVVIGLIVGVVFLIIKLAAAANAPPTIAADKWVPLQVPGKFSVILPGQANRQPIAAGPMQMVMYQCDPSKSLTTGVGYTEGVLPAERRALPATRLLDDSCDGAAANLRQMGGRELGRSWIKLGNYPGREMVVRVPQGQGKMVFRVYLVRETLYMVMVGGKGIEPDGEIARKVFDSFKVLE